jgi:XTP/dITP diphosphohydrolase
LQKGKLIDRLETVKSKLTTKVIFFASGNIHKFEEARVVLACHGLATAMIKLKGFEIQSDSLEEIAAHSAFEASKRSGLPILVEDAGLFVEDLAGFPGPYAAYVFKTIKNAGLLKLVKDLPNRRAVFRSVVAYCESNFEKPICFHGEVIGRIIGKEKKKGKTPAFGFDPIFSPEGSRLTFAEMSLKEKNTFSHRAKALDKFGNWYMNRTQN